MPCCEPIFGKDAHCPYANRANSDAVSGNGRIVGTVINDDGEKIAGAVLCVSVYQGWQFRTGSRGDGRRRCVLRQEAGCWDDDPQRLSRTRKVKLTREEPLAHVELTVGPKPGLLSIAVTNNNTRKALDSFIVRWIDEDGRSMNSSVGNLQRAGAYLLVPIRPATDVIVQISAPRFKDWYFVDTSTMQPTWRLQSGEQRTLDVALEPSPTFLLTACYLNQEPAGSHARCKVVERISVSRHFLLPN